MTDRQLQLRRRFTVVNRGAPLLKKAALVRGKRDHLARPVLDDRESDDGAVKCVSAGSEGRRGPVGGWRRAGRSTDHGSRSVLGSSPVPCREQETECHDSEYQDRRSRRAELHHSLQNHVLPPIADRLQARANQ